MAAGGPPALLAAVARARARAAWTRWRAPRRRRWRGRARASTRWHSSGVSERQLRRRFVDAVGYGPKTLARVLRFQRFLALARGRGELARAGVRSRLRRPGAPHPRVPAARRRARRRELVASGAGPAGERVRFVQAAESRAAPTVRRDDRTSRGVHLVDRARAGAAAIRVAVQGRRSGRVRRGAGAATARRRRLRVRAGARRARADEPAAAHLDGAARCSRRCGA